MAELPAEPRQIRLRSFYGFDPDHDGYIGWTEIAARDRMLAMIEDGDLFMIYGASSNQTAISHRKQVLGFLQVEARAIRDTDKASAFGMQRKKADGFLEKWTYAIPVIRAWKADESILVERIAQETYRSEAGQAIAVWSPQLVPKEMDLALKIKVSEVNVFGQASISDEKSKEIPLLKVFQPSRAFRGGSGERVVIYEDSPTRLYLALFEGDGFALLGKTKVSMDKTVLIKIGVSNDTVRRVEELNVGFPPESVGKWKMGVVSQPYSTCQLAEASEQRFKDIAKTKMRSLGGEFFSGDWSSAQVIFATLPGVSRYGG